MGGYYEIMNGSLYERVKYFPRVRSLEEIRSLILRAHFVRFSGHQYLGIGEDLGRLDFRVKGSLSGYFDLLVFVFALLFIFSRGGMRSPYDTSSTQKDDGEDRG